MFAPCTACLVFGIRTGIAVLYFIGLEFGILDSCSSFNIFWDMIFWGVLFFLFYPLTICQFMVNSAFLLSLTG